MEIAEIQRLEQAVRDLYRLGNSYEFIKDVVCDQTLPEVERGYLARIVDCVAAENPITLADVRGSILVAVGDDPDMCWNIAKLYDLFSTSGLPTTSLQISEAVHQMIGDGRLVFDVALGLRVTMRGVLQHQL